MISCAQQVEMLEQQLAARMEQLQATVQSKTAVPTAQVYVRFFFIFQYFCIKPCEQALMSKWNCIIYIFCLLVITKFKGCIQK